MMGLWIYARAFVRRAPLVFFVAQLSIKHYSLSWNFENEKTEPERLRFPFPTDVEVIKPL